MATLATEETSVPTPTSSPRPWLTDAAVLACYSVLAVLVMGRMWIDPDHRVPPGHEPDPNLFKWFIAYAARAVTHLENPFFTTMQGAPDGVNLMGNTSVLGLGIPFTPVTLVFGAGVSFVAMLTLGLAGTAAGWYYVLRRHLGVSRLAAAIGGGLCGFAPALVAHALGHLHLTAQFVIPFIVSFVLRLSESRRPLEAAGKPPVERGGAQTGIRQGGGGAFAGWQRRRRQRRRAQFGPRRSRADGFPSSLFRDGAILGLLIAYQGLIGEEVLLLAALGLGLFVGVYALCHPTVARRSWKPFTTGLGVAAAVAAVLLAYPLWMQFFGPQSYHGLDPAAQGFGANVKAYTTFATQTVFGDRAGNARLAQNYAEENSFFGWPLVLLTIGLSVWMWRSRLVWVLAVVAGIFALFSLSAVVRVGDRLVTTHGPWGVFAKLPLFDAVIPSRFAMIVVPAIAVIIALGIDRIRSVGAPALRVASLAMIALAMVTVFPTPLPGGGQSAVPRFITEGMWKPYVSPEGTLVTVPLTSPGASSTLRWAAAADVGYAIPRGYFLAPEKGERGAQGTFWPPERFLATVLDQVNRDGRIPEITEANRAAAREDLRFWRASALVLDRQNPRAEALRATVDALVGAGSAVADVYLWDVRSLVGQE